MDNIEYINAYVELLNKKLHDMVSKEVMQETHLTLANQTILNLQAQLQQVIVENEKLATELDKLKKKKGITTPDPSDGF